MKNLYYELANLSPIELLNIYGVRDIIEEQLNDTVVLQWEQPQELPFANIDETTI
jgi:hypothetical protein